MKGRILRLSEEIPPSLAAGGGAGQREWFMLLLGEGEGPAFLFQEGAPKTLPCPWPSGLFPPSAGHDVSALWEEFPRFRAVIEARVPAEELFFVVPKGEVFIHPLPEPPARIMPNGRFYRHGWTAYAAGSRVPLHRQEAGRFLPEGDCVLERFTDKTGNPIAGDTLVAEEGWEWLTNRRGKPVRRRLVVPG